MDKLGFGNKIKAFASAKKRIMRAVAQNSLTFFKVKSFDDQGFTDRTLSRWAPRKENRDSDRKLLVDSSAGRSSIHIAKQTDEMALIAAEAEYMRFHNEGTKKLPKRKFMGDSKVLDAQNKKIIGREMRGVL